MYKQQLNRYFFYSLGVILLSIGITLNTKTALGVSPLISVPYSVSQIWHLSFPLMTFFLYSFFIVLQFILKGKQKQLKDLLQLPLAAVCSFLLDVFGSGYDWLIDVSGLQIESFVSRFILLLIAVPMTGIGAYLMVSMNLIPNPADGLADTIGAVFKRDFGFGKNVLDISSFTVTCIIGFIATGRPVGVGLGTVVGMIGVGRCIAGFNYLLNNKLMLAIGDKNRMTMSLQ